MPHDVDALLSEIQALRKKLVFFQHHHRCCSIVPPPSPPHTQPTRPSDGFQIIPFSPRCIELPKPRDTIPRWRTIADQILKDVLVPEQWTERRTKLGLDTTTWLTTAILGAQEQFSHRATDQPTLEVMVSAKKYAENTKVARGRAETFTRGIIRRCVTERHVRRCGD
jgi:hypothetical protein